ncbi:Uncharacterised protein [Vibrio cholerae]|uniref:Uncharacterized protein n=1 Tax=Vibrio cholerae TaxID=666 RepID=A0A655XT79_VIBCL|nr:Uncharacterised protein [Vibrio cholerae]CSB67704.1 Uncharacterised protein [Vibrio cholerae]CSC21892.1 Uncharacterised protein [Vibrio cholerae]CSC47420.1 Uncharacterised protein [Vibrio cholerae]CSC51914.1 Uncharacterised protein [Vibrio cholerae]
MCHFGVELHAVVFLLFIGHRSVWAGIGLTDFHEIRWDFDHFVTVAHPNVLREIEIFK